MDTQKTTSFTLQKSISLFLIDKLEAGDITEDRAAEIARESLDLIPDEMNEDQAHSIIQTLTTNYPELTQIFHSHMEEKTKVADEAEIEEIKKTLA